MVGMLDNTFATIAHQPTLVASAQVPWHGSTYVSTSSPLILNATGVNSAPAMSSGAPGPLAASPVTLASVNPNTTLAAPPPSVLPSASDDEDAAETKTNEGNTGLTPHVGAPVLPPPRTVVAQSPPPETGEGDIDDAGTRASADIWMIQIGAFPTQASAQAQLADYARKSIDLLRKVARVIAPLRADSGQTVYRARFGPFAERDARDVCSRLLQRGETCFATVVSN